MGISKLTGFTAEAEVMGRLIEVAFHEDDGLLLRGLSHDEALTALDTLAARHVAVVNPLKAVESKMPDAKLPEVKGKKAKAEKPPETLEQAKVVLDKTEAPEAPKVDEPKTPPPPDPGTSAVAAAMASGMTPSDAARELASRAAAAQEAVNNVVPLKAPEGSVPDITKAKQLKDVLLILMEHHGIKTPEAMIAKCEELKPTVPVLSRISDIPNRVKRTMELLSA